jgi:hypothetical protein
VRLAPIYTIVHAGFCVSTILWLAHRDCRIFIVRAWCSECVHTLDLGLSSHPKDVRVTSPKYFGRLIRINVFKNTLNWLKIDSVDQKLFKIQLTRVWELLTKRWNTWHWERHSVFTAGDERVNDAVNLCANDENPIHNVPIIMHIALFSSCSTDDVSFHALTYSVDVSLDTCIIFCIKTIVYHCIQILSLKHGTDVALKYMFFPMFFHCMTFPVKIDGLCKWTNRIFLFPVHTWILSVLKAARPAVHHAKNVCSRLNTSMRGRISLEI